MFIAQVTEISFINMSSPRPVHVRLQFPPNSSINAVDGDSRTQKIYYTDLNSRTIGVANINGSSQSTVCTVHALNLY